MSNQSVYQVSDENFIKIATKAPNIHQALKAMGLNGKGANYSVFKRRCDKLNISLPNSNHLKKKDFSLREKIIDKQIISLCKDKISARSVILQLGLRESGTNAEWLKKKIKVLNIDTTHWLGKSFLKGKSHNWSNKIALKKILVKDSLYTNRVALKKRLLQAKLLEYKCYECSISTWNNKFLSLHLEHKNGINNDHRIENLTLLCPNCHSQTSTYCGRNKNRED